MAWREAVEAVGRLAALQPLHTRHISPRSPPYHWPGSIRLIFGIIPFIHCSDPIYPDIARQAQISGSVQLSVIIGEDGHIQQATIVSGHPLLRQAAKDAVVQWVYQPTLVDNQPVKVSSTVDVVFTPRL
jgi:TonB family protein